MAFKKEALEYPTVPYKLKSLKYAKATASSNFRCFQIGCHFQYFLAGQWSCSLPFQIPIPHLHKIFPVISISLKL